MKLIAFETATEACSVALWNDGEVLERFAIAPRRHAELALPWVDALLAEAGIGRRQLDAVAVGRGPGAFTGVRLGIALAQGIALGLERPVVAVSTLKVLAAGTLAGAGGSDEGRRIVSAIDARMGEIYVASWQVRSGELAALDDDVVIAPEAYRLPDDGDGWHGVGSGFAANDGALHTRLHHRFAAIDATALPRAGALARLAVRDVACGAAIAPEQLEPAYLRNQVALTLAEQQAARA